MRRTIAELTRACRARPEDTLLQVELARHLYRDGRSVEALTHLQVAIEAVAEPASLLSLLYEWTGRAVVRGPWPCPSGDPEGRRLSEACGPRRGFVEHRLRLGSGGSSRFKNPGGGAEYAVSATADQRSVYVSSQRGHVFCFDASSWNRVGEAPGRSGRASAPLLLPFGLPLITTDGCLTLYKQALAGELWRHDVEGPDAPLERLVTPPLALIGGLLMLKTARSLTLFDLSVGRARAQHSLTPTQRGVLRPAHGRLIGPAGAEGLDVRGLDGVLQRQLRWPREARLGPRPGLIVDPDRRLYVSSPARRPDPLTLAFEHPELESLCGPKPPRLRRLASPPARRYRGRAIAIARSGRVLQADDRSPRWLNWLDPESGRGRALQLANEHLEARRRCASPDGPVAAIDAEGVAFLAIHDLLGAFDAGGRHLFTLRAPAPIVCGPVLTPNASLILGLDDGMLLVVQ